MSSNTFNTTAPGLLPILAELIAREPIFHRPAFAATPQDFALMTAPDYWEVGASGRRYTRSFILETLEKHPPIDAATAGWQILDPQCRQLGKSNYLLSYTLHQNDRHTRRSTIWQRTAAGWQVLYHQGTIITDDPHDSAPHPMKQ